MIQFYESSRSNVAFGCHVTSAEVVCCRCLCRTTAAPGNNGDSHAALGEGEYGVWSLRSSGRCSCPQLCFYRREPGWKRSSGSRWNRLEPPRVPSSLFTWVIYELPDQIAERFVALLWFLMHLTAEAGWWAAFQPGRAGSLSRLGPSGLSRAGRRTLLVLFLFLMPWL